jgi:hypothetical protein
MHIYQFNTLTVNGVRGNISVVEQYKQKITHVVHRAYFPYFVAFVICGLISIGALRHNNTTMVNLRDDVYTADRNNNNVQGALDKLQAYVTSHMNTDLSTANGIKPPIQLAYTYARLEGQAGSNSSLYTEAENYCQQLIPASVSISGRGRIGCITDYVTNHGAKTVNVPAALYQFDFISPSWSPDLAGWSLVATAIAFLLFVYMFLRGMWLRHQWHK